MEILQCFENIKNIFIKNGYEQLKKLNIKLNQTPIKKNNNLCHGFTKSTLDKKTKINDDYELISVIPEYIIISTQNITLNNLIFVLLHEFGHCVSHVESVRNNGVWTNEYHGKEFYKHFVKILRDAEKFKIFNITFINKNKFSIETIIRIDNMNLHESNINIGKSELFNINNSGIRLNLYFNDKKKLIFVKNKENIIECIKNSTNIKNFTIYSSSGTELSLNDIHNDMIIHIKKI